jgi:RNA polymerase sigma-70 factor (ECF subfamily)
VADDDGDLVERCLAGDQEACGTLVDAHARMVGTVIWRATGNRDAVEDLAQETFLRVFRGLAYFDRRSRVSTWIYTIAHRVAIDHLRAAGRWRYESFDPTADDARRAVETWRETAASAEAHVIREEEARRVQEALARLPDKYRLPLTYATIEGLDYPTIAVMLGVTVGSVKTLVFRARRMLRDALANAV